MLREDRVQLPGGVGLGVRRVAGRGQPFLLVHGLASNSLLWAGVGERLAQAGHEVVAVDLRGHGRSDQAAQGYTTERNAADLAELCALLGCVGERAPIVAGQSWGAHVALTLAVDHGGVAGLALVDGGWFVVGEQFATFEDCWAQLAPPDFNHLAEGEFRQRLREWRPQWPAEALEAVLGNFTVRADGTVAARLTREHHREILRSMFGHDPRPLYPKVSVPTLLVVAGDPADERPPWSDPVAAADAIPDADLRWHPGADHDVHLERPDDVAADLLALARRVDGGDRKGVA